ncbi:hypothetical protein [Haloarchaeobius sp. TZWWS8]|uniref:hypothetical protein n=1 Tax=Haloarchaeobius sp. TZWWS8 TaxID=3446121 RepID=UPI003EBC4C17
MAVFVGSDGNYYTASEVVEHIEADEWTPQLWDEETGRELVETQQGEVLLLIPAKQADFETSVQPEPSV